MAGRTVYTVLDASILVTMPDRFAAPTLSSPEPMRVTRSMVRAGSARSSCVQATSSTSWSMSGVHASPTSPFDASIGIQRRLHPGRVPSPLNPPNSRYIRTGTAPRWLTLRSVDQWIVHSCFPHAYMHATEILMPI